MKTIIRFIAWHTYLVAALIFCSSALAATSSLSISPSGALTSDGAVSVVVTLNNPNNYQLRSASIKLNGSDVTTIFGNAAVKSNNGTTTTYLVKYLFGPGTYSVSAAASLAAPGGNTFEDLTATTQFTLPGDIQEQRKNTIVSKINEFIHQWDGRKFASAMSLGDIGIFRSRAYEAGFSVRVSPGELPTQVAKYVDEEWWNSIVRVYQVYFQVLIIATEPQNFSLNGQPNDSETLWHEMIHAISHGLEVHTGSKPLSLTDHSYIGRAEACIREFSQLERMEDYLAQTGIHNTAPDVVTKARGYWKYFFKMCTKREGSLYLDEGPYPSDAQMAELKSMTGIEIDANKIKDNYIRLGYAPEYFNDIMVSITSPSTGTQTNENQVKVEATFTNNEPSLTVDHVGFSVNGVIQEAPRAGNVFGTTAVMKTGDNSVIAGVQTTDGQIFQSTPVTVKSTAINNTYHARISWDKNDTDVDLHFSWSGGSECFYSNKTPTWVAAATSPRLDVDNRTGYGPENITIGGLPGPGTYRVSVKYYSDHGKGPTTVNAAVYENGVAKFTGSRTMIDGENWTLMEFTIN